MSLAPASRRFPALQQRKLSPWLWRGRLRALIFFERISESEFNTLDVSFKMHHITGRQAATFALGVGACLVHSETGVAAGLFPLHLIFRVRHCRQALEIRRRLIGGSDDCDGSWVELVDSEGELRGDILKM